MKRSIYLILIGILALSVSGCDFSVFATATPVAPVSLGVPTPTAVVTPTPLPAAISIAADTEELLLENLYDRTNPGVVNIDLVSGTGAGATEFGSGSGFVIDPAGHIVTNNHVVEGADELDVTFSVGIVSGKGRTLQADPTASTGASYSNPDIIQTDAAINPGNSGGPLLNSSGEVIAVNAAIRTTTSSNRANSGVGFSIPSNTVRRVVDQLLKDGRASYPYLGISVDNHFGMGILAQALNLPVSKGVLIASVIQGGPADKAGLLGGDHQTTVRGLPVSVGGDILTAIDTDPITSFEQMISYLSNKRHVGETVTVTILRGTETLQIPVTLTDRPN